LTTEAETSAPAPQATKGLGPGITGVEDVC
jgi:hypothetical protein